MKNLREEIDNTLRLSGMFSGGKLYEDKNGNPRFEGEDIKEMLLDKLLSLFKQQMKEERKEFSEKIDRYFDKEWTSSHFKTPSSIETAHKDLKVLLKKIEEL